MRLMAVEERPTLLLLKVYAVKRNLLHQPFTRLKASTKDSPLISTKPENGANIGFHMILSHLTVKIVFSSPPTPSSLHNNPFPSILGLETSHRGPLDQYLPSLNQRIIRLSGSLTETLQGDMNPFLPTTILEVTLPSENNTCICIYLLHYQLQKSTMLYFGIHSSEISASAHIKNQSFVDHAYLLILFTRQ